MRSRADGAPAWCWVPELAENGATFELDEASAHHVTRVWRARVGDRVTLTDGRGAVARVELTTTGRVTGARVLARRELARPAERTLLFGAPEGERADWLIEKAVEFGVTALVPVDTQRAPWRHSERARERWRRLARAALGQSRRAWLPELAEPLPLDRAIERFAGVAARWVADAGGVPAAGVRIDPGTAQVGVVGPAEGLDPSESMALRDREFLPISLADGRLRAETAAMALMAWWSATASEVGLDPF